MVGVIPKKGCPSFFWYDTDSGHEGPFCITQPMSSHSFSPALTAAQCGSLKERQSISLTGNTGATAHTNNIIYNVSINGLRLLDSM